MSKRDKFSRNAVASSRGSYVRKSHYLYIQEQLNARGIEASLEDIIEVSITVKAKTRYAVKCFGKIKFISEFEASQLDSNLVIHI